MQKTKKIHIFANDLSPRVFAYMNREPKNDVISKNKTFAFNQTKEFHDKNNRKINETNTDNPCPRLGPTADGFRTGEEASPRHFDAQQRFFTDCLRGW